jgi:hypothetical protein
MDLKDIKSRIFKGKDGWNNYMNVAIEEMDWLVEQTEKVEGYKKAIRKSIFLIDEVFTDESEADTALRYVFDELKQAWRD